MVRILTKFEAKNRIDKGIEVFGTEGSPTFLGILGRKSGDENAAEEETDVQGRVKCTNP